MASTRRILTFRTKAAAGDRHQAENLSQTRREHAHETAEDYVEAIADLIAETGEARVVDLAKRLGVTHVSVNRTVVRLQRLGYVTSQPYRAIFLTDAGRRLAAACKRRHQIVVKFLLSLGVPRRIAEMDAEGIEHHVSPRTLAAFKRALGNPAMSTEGRPVSRPQPRSNGSSSMAGNRRHPATPAASL